MAASDMRNRRHVQPLLTWSTDSSCIPGLGAHTRYYQPGQLNPGFLELVKKGISKGELATHQVNQLALFSTNERYEEIPTADIKYLLLPAYLGQLSGLISGPERLSGLDRAEVYYKDFLSRCQSYEVPDLPPIEDQTPTLPSFLRAYKIQELKKQKSLETRESELRKLLEKETTDDSTARELYLVRIQKWALQASREMRNIQEERPLLQRFLNQDNKTDRPKLQKKCHEEQTPCAATPNMEYKRCSSCIPGLGALTGYYQPDQLSPGFLPPRSNKPPTTMIITRDKVQQAIYGLGYPSLPVYTIEDFYQQRFAHQQQHPHLVLGIILKKGGGSRSTFALTNIMIGFHPEDHRPPPEDEDKEESDEAIARARNFDDWKDTHRRGCGNRHNMG
ncbi:IGBP1 [Cordylochernes scorpioides]|uniref:IGBP1 n=1 Tax=Cordylochernes scorpioides TaxID=51811 RepID=A0ABY6LNT1_9ARAC|nr:IGBP1 [Cordylochernes scorpioides]